MSDDLRITKNLPSPEPPGAAGEPVFLHSMWRTGSTFVFGGFRNNERYRCFYEPLNEGLARFSERMIAHYSGPPAARRMRHAEMDLPYFEEYRPLRRRWGGVRGYHARFAFHDFFREHNEALAKYFRMLLASAAAEGRQGMFKLCRSYGRLGAMRREFSGRHAYLIRNPRDQWQSYMLKGRPYWMAMTCVIAALRPGPASDLSARLSRPLPTYLRCLRFFGPLSVGYLLGAGKRYCRSLSAADTYRIFHHEWRLAHDAAAQHCQVLIDVDRLSVDTAYRAQVEEQFDLRLDGCRVKHYERYELPPGQMSEIEAEYAETMR